MSVSPSHLLAGAAFVDRSDLRARDLLRLTDWSRIALTIEDDRDVELAAHAIAQGGIACHPFANFYVFTARPREAIVRYVNQIKGRPADQTGSVVTTPEHLANLFDWSLLHDGVRRERVQALMDALIALGPFGFRGPARPRLPEFLTQDDHGVRTVQVISPGVACPSNVLYTRALELIGGDYLYGTSGNRSRRQTGAEDEPVHYRLAPLQEDFGRFGDFFMLGTGDEAALARRYPVHQQMSATVLSFHKLGPDDGGLPRLVVERHGSLELSALRRITAQFGFGLALAPAAQRRLTARTY
jgi:hypothetical protein